MMNSFSKAYQGKKVFITGHTGFKGSWLSLWLSELGAEVSGYSIDVPTNPSLYEKIQLHKLLKHDFRGDVSDRETLKKALEESKPDLVFHLAAQPLVRLSYDDPVSTFQSNVLGTAQVLDLVRRMPEIQGVVNITSDKCYENFEWGYSYRENDRMGGKDPYSASKGCAELVFSSFFRSFFEHGSQTVVTARAGNVIGGGDYAKDRIVPDCVRAWQKNEKVELRSPHAVRPWQHVLECLSGYLVLGEKVFLEPKTVHGEGFNFGPKLNVNQTVLELVQSFQKNWDQAKFEISQDAKRELSKKPEASLLKLNIEKAYDKLKWQPVLDFEETVKMTASWYHQDQSSELLGLSKSQIKHYCEIAHSQNSVWV